MRAVPFREWIEMLPAPMEIADFVLIGERFVLLTLHQK